MKLALIGIMALLGASAVNAQVHVRGYTRSNGTYVAPYVRSAPDNSIHNNYSTVPNVNPYSGKVGTVNPYAPSSLYSAPKPYGSTTTKQPCYFNCN